MDFSILLNIILGIYGAFLTTLTIIKSNKEKKRQVLVRLSTGWHQKFADAGLEPQMLLITVINPGHINVTVNTPYLELPDGKFLVISKPLANVQFPYRLPEGSKCAMWVKMNEIKKSLKERGYTGKIKLWGNVTDAVGKIYRSKKASEFDLDLNYD